MDKLDSIIGKFQALKEDLAKNINASYGSTPNMVASGGGAMRMSEKTEKNDPKTGMPEGTIAKEDLERNATEMRAEMARTGYRAYKAEDGDIDKDEDGDMEKKHIGFKALEHKLEDEGHSKESAGNIAYAVGKKKYGKEGMAERAHKAEDAYKADAYKAEDKEPHEGDSKHEEKEEKIADKQKQLAEKLKEMHKDDEGKKEYLKLFKNGQWQIY